MLEWYSFCFHSDLIASVHWCMRKPFSIASFPRVSLFSTASSATLHGMSYCTLSILQLRLYTSRGTFAFSRFFSTSLIASVMVCQGCTEGSVLHMWLCGRPGMGGVLLPNVNPFYLVAVQDNTLLLALDTQQGSTVTAAVAERATTCDLTTLDCRRLAVGSLQDLNRSVADLMESDGCTGILTSTVCIMGHLCDPPALLNSPILWWHKFLQKIVKQLVLFSNSSGTHPGRVTVQGAVGQSRMWWRLPLSMAPQPTTRGSKT